MGYWEQKTRELIFNGWMSHRCEVLKVERRGFIFLRFFAAMIKDYKGTYRNVWRLGLECDRIENKFKWKFVQECCHADL